MTGPILPANDFSQEIHDEISIGCCFALALYIGVRAI